MRAIILSAFLMLGIDLFAQDHKWNFGVNAGGLTSYAQPNIGNSSLYLGYYAGLTANRAFNKHFLNLDFGLLRKGAISEANFPVFDDYSDFHAKEQLEGDFLQLDIAYGYSFGKKLKIIPLAGIYAGYAARGKASYSLSYTRKSDNSHFSEHYESEFGDELIYPLDYGLTTGAIFKYERLALTGKFQYGLSSEDIYPYDNPPTYRTFLFTLGYYLRK